MNLIQPLDTPEPVKLTIGQFELLDRSGCFDAHSKTELIDGALFAMNSQYRRHSYAKNELTYRLRRALEHIGSEFVPQSESTVSMPPVSAPEPDIVVTKSPRGANDFIPVDSVALLVEISDASAVFDLGDKATLYAENHVPEYWVLEIPAATLHQFWGPEDSHYRESRSISIGERIESLTIPGLAVESDGLI